MLELRVILAQRKLKMAGLEGLARHGCASAARCAGTVVGVCKSRKNERRECQRQREPAHECRTIHRKMLRAKPMGLSECRENELGIHDRRSAAEVGDEN